MRAFVTAGMLMVAACSTGEAEQNNISAAAEALEPGQWETVMEVVRVDKADEAEPALKLAAGEKVTTTSCVGEGEPPAVIFAGLEDASCTYENNYLKRGRINVSLSCTKPGLSGTVGVSTEGDFKADSFEGNATLRTMLSTAGDSIVTARLTGRRTGDCAAAAPKAG